MFQDNSALATDKAKASAHYEPKTVEYTLIAEETTLEVAPNKRVEAWTYNGTIPGPTLRATEVYPKIPVPPIRVGVASNA